MFQNRYYLLFLIPILFFIPEDVFGASYNLDCDTTTIQTASSAVAITGCDIGTDPIELQPLPPELELTITAEPSIISPLTAFDTLSLADIDDDLVYISWNTISDMQINSITIDDKNLDGIKIEFRQSPFILKGDKEGLGYSSDIIAYRIQIPTQFCTEFKTMSCLRQTEYEIPVVFNLIHENRIIEQGMIIPVKIEKDESLIFLLAIGSLALVLTLAVYGLLKGSGKRTTRRKVRQAQQIRTRKRR